MALELISFLFLIHWFINFWLQWVFIAARGLSLVEVSRGYALLQCLGFSFQYFLQLWTTGFRHGGFSSCGSRALGCRCMDLAALWHVKSSWTRDRTCVPCIGGHILIHCTTREVLEFTSCDFLPLWVLHFFLYQPHHPILLTFHRVTIPQPPEF